MIESREYPFLPVTLEVRNVHESVSAFVDTGFDGFLILADRYLSQLGPPDFVGRWTLAESGKAVARTGLRMMPTFPPPPLKFRTVSFPQYGFKASLSANACPNGGRVKRAPHIPRQAFGLRPPSRTPRLRDPR